MDQADTEEIKIVPIAEDHIESYHSCLDSVARERKYLGGVRAFPIETTREFVRNNIKNGYPQFVAVEGEKVVGWCDILPQRGEGFKHSGTLGMGVLHGYRGKRIGTRLMQATMDAAKEIGLERIELEVYASNTRAYKMYEKWGFQVEGVKKQARKLDGKYDDIIMMALFLDQ